jgi:hypothetical protein
MMMRKMGEKDGRYLRGLINGVPSGTNHRAAKAP